MTILLIMVIALQALSEAEKIKTNNEEAKTLLTNAVSTLAKIGGIGSFEAPQGQAPFPQNKIEGLSDRERKKMLDEVIQDLRRAIELDASLEEAYHFLGVAYILADMADKAIEALRVAIHVKAQKETSYVYLCSLLWNNKEFDEAHRILERFSKKYPEKRQKWLILKGTTYYHEGRYRDAIEKAEEIIRLEEKNIAGHLLLASANFLLGDQNKADIQFRKIIELNPQMASEIERIKGALEKKRAQQ